MTWIELSFQIGMPRIVLTSERRPTDWLYCVSGQLAPGFSDRFASPGPRYCTYTQIQRTQLL